MKNLFLIIFIILGTIMAAMVNDAKQSPPEIKGRYYYFIENIELENDNPEILLWLALPLSLDQNINIMEIYPEPTEIITDDKYGNRIVFWKINKLNGRKSILFYYEFEMNTSRIKYNVDPERVDLSEVDTNCLKEEPWIEITPEIKKKAEEVIGKESNPCKKAYLIFKWVVSNMEYEYPEMSRRGSAKSFKRLRGDCGEYSVVFAAMCRAVGIPAFTVTMNWPWEDGGGHQVATVILPPFGNIFVDPSMADLMTKNQNVLDPKKKEEFLKKLDIDAHTKPEYFFGNLYDNRIFIFYGNNVEFKSEKTGITRTFRFMQPGGNNAYPPAIEFKNISKNVVHGGFFLFNEKSQDLEYAKEKAEIILASQYLSVGNYEKAEEGLKKALEINSQNGSAWLQIGQIYINTGRIELAITAFNNCLNSPGGSAKPITDVWAHNLLGICYMQIDENEKAIKQFSIVIESGIDYNNSLNFARENLKKIKEK